MANDNLVTALNAIVAAVQETKKENVFSGIGGAENLHKLVIPDAIITNEELTTLLSEVKKAKENDEMMAAIVGTIIQTLKLALLVK